MRCLRAGARFKRIWELLAVQRMVRGQLMERFAEEAAVEHKRLLAQNGWADTGRLQRTLVRASVAALHRTASGSVASQQGGWCRGHGLFEVQSPLALASALLASSQDKMFLRLNR